MTASIKISDKAKKVIENLQARLVLEKGKKISQIDLMDKLLDEFLKNHAGIENLVDTPVDTSDIDVWLKRTRSPPDWRITDSSENIDEQIAGQ
jgi:hypothetical protein